MISIDLMYPEDSPSFSPVPYILDEMNVLNLDFKVFNC